MQCALQTCDALSLGMFASSFVQISSIYRFKRFVCLLYEQNERPEIENRIKTVMKRNEQMRREEGIMQYSAETGPKYIPVF